MRQELIYKVEAIASGLASLDSRLNICVNRNLAVEMEAETEDGEFWLKPDYAKEKIAQQEDYDKWYAEQSAWLKSNPEYLDKVPDNLKEAAKIAAQIEEVKEPVVAEVAMASETVSE